MISDAFFSKNCQGMRKIDKIDRNKSAIIRIVRTNILKKR